MELLADAGVDVLFFDCTNGSYLWEKSCIALFDVIAAARADGIAAPRACFMLPFAANDDSKQSLIKLYKRFYSKEEYNEIWFYWDGKVNYGTSGQFISEKRNRERNFGIFYIQEKLAWLFRR